MAAPVLCGKGLVQPPLGQSPQGSIISAWDKGAGVENPIVGPHMEISLIYSPRLPQAFCPRLFVYCSQLLPQGGLRAAWQSLNRTVSPSAGPCPLVPAPVYCKRKGKGDKRTPKDQSPARALAPTTQEALSLVLARQQPPAQLDPHSPAWGTL